MTDASAPKPEPKLSEEELMRALSVLGEPHIFSSRERFQASNQISTHIHALTAQLNEARAAALGVPMKGDPPPPAPPPTPEQIAARKAALDDLRKDVRDARDNARLREALTGIKAYADTHDFERYGKYGAEIVSAMVARALSPPPSKEKT